MEGREGGRKGGREITKDRNTLEIYSFLRKLAPQASTPHPSSSLLYFLPPPRLPPQPSVSTFSFMPLSCILACRRACSSLLRSGA